MNPLEMQIRRGKEKEMMQVRRGKEKQTMQVRRGKEKQTMHVTNVVSAGKSALEADHAGAARLGELNVRFTVYHCM
jgi:hypothetical protein